MQQSAIIDLAVRQKFLLDNIDAWLLERPTLIVEHKRSHAVLPVLVLIACVVRISIARIIFLLIRCRS
jgi:hypothetical protein